MGTKPQILGMCGIIAVQMLCFVGYLKFDPYLNGDQCWLVPPCTETQRIIPFLAINEWQTRPENSFRDRCHLEHYLWHRKITLKNSLHTGFTNLRKKTQKFCLSQGSDEIWPVSPGKFTNSFPNQDPFLQVWCSNCCDRRLHPSLWRDGHLWVWPWTEEPTQAVHWSGYGPLKYVNGYGLKWFMAFYLSWFMDWP